MYLFYCTRNSKLRGEKEKGAGKEKRERELERESEQERERAREGERERVRDREREIFHLMAYSPNGCYCHTGMKLGFFGF